MFGFVIAAVVSVCFVRPFFLFFGQVWSDRRHGVEAFPRRTGGKHDQGELQT